MNEVLVLDNVKIRRDSKGRYCLNDLHKAAVEAGHNYKSCQVEHFLRNDKTQELINEISKNGELEFSPCESKVGRYGGTYVVKELVYSYAMWISPAFHLKVIEFYHRLQTQGIAVADHAVDAVLEDPLAFMEKLFNQAKRILAERDQLKAELAIAASKPVVFDNNL